MLTRNDKEAIVKALRVDIEKSQAIFLTNLVGIPSNDAVRVRKDVRQAKGKVVVTRNTLFRQAAVGTPAEKLMSKLKGTNAVAFAFSDPAAVAKCLKNANKEMELVELRGGILDGKQISTAELKALADLPSKDQLLGLLLATFIAPVSALARVLYAIQEKKESEAATV